MTSSKARHPSRRKPHRKSRRGCLQCKKRHAKCGEQHPACTNCTSSGRRCSYLDLVPASRPGSDPSSGSNLAAGLSNSHPILHPNTPLESPCRSVADAEAEIETSFVPPASSPSNLPLAFELRHLVLLHHYDTVLSKDIFVGARSDNGDHSSMSEVVFESAISAPYLLFEILAFSAAHLSTIQSDPTERERNYHIAEELQTQALSLFNQSRPYATDKNCVPIFLFSSLIGMHTLFNATATPTKHAEFLNKFIQYLRIHRGVRSVARQDWQSIQNSGVKYILDSLAVGDSVHPESSEVADESDKLTELLSTARPTLTDSLFQVCNKAVHQLQDIFKQYRRLSKHTRIHSTLTWPICISAEYIDLLEQRQPISLVILSYWAILLHNESEFWVFGNAGQTLIDAVAGYLGTYWDEWLALPREAVSQTINNQSPRNR